MTTVTAAVAIAPKRTELQAFPLPAIPADGGLLRIEAAGVCGSDWPAYQRVAQPKILGHENVGRIVEIGAIARERWGVEAGDRVVIEEYLPCGFCEWCRAEDFRLCDQTDIWMGGMRYGSTTTEIPPALWGGFGQYQFLHPRSVLHRIDDDVPAELAALAIPLSNGFQWACIEAGATFGKTVVVQGPGQQGLACVVAAKNAGASRVIISGLPADARRLELAKRLGADDTFINDGTESLTEFVREATGGRMAEIVIETSSGGPQTIVDAFGLVRKHGTLILGGEKHRPIPAFDADPIVSRTVRVQGVRGHSYRAVELALELIRSQRFPLHELCTNSFSLDEVDQALRTLGGELGNDAIHVTVLPWR